MYFLESRVILKVDAFAQSAVNLLRLVPQSSATKLEYRSRDLGHIFVLLDHNRSWEVRVVDDSRMVRKPLRIGIVKR